MASNRESMLEPAGPGRAEARRQRVVDVARCLFAKHGFHGTGIARIATDSGVAVAQIYRDFGSKEDIVASIVEQACGGMLDNEALSAALDARDEPAIRAWIARVVEPTSPSKLDDSIFNEIMAESARSARMASIFRTAHDRVRATLCSALTLFAPGEEMAESRTMLAETILTLGIGLRHRPLIESSVRNDALVATFQRFIEDEIAKLEGEATRRRQPV